MFTNGRQIRLYVKFEKTIRNTVTFKCWRFDVVFDVMTASSRRGRFKITPHKLCKLWPRPAVLGRKTPALFCISDRAAVVNICFMRGVRSANHIECEDRECVSTRPVDAPHGASSASYLSSLGHTEGVPRSRLGKVDKEHAVGLVRRLQSHSPIRQNWMKNRSSGFGCCKTQ